MVTADPRSVQQTRPDMLFVAVIGDLVGSRQLPGTRRGEVQIALGRLMDRLNQEFAAGLRAKFVITLGDEFEGLVRVQAASRTIPDLIWTIEEALPDPVSRVGIGLGGIDTPIQDDVTVLDGPAFHHAREAIGAAAKNEHLGGEFRGFGDNHDAILNGIARVLHHQRRRWSRQQRNLAMLLHRGTRKSEAAAAMDVSRQAISIYAQAAGWDAYEEGELAWRKALEESISGVNLSLTDLSAAP
jgi:SatD family (SatD)